MKTYVAKLKQQHRQELHRMAQLVVTLTEKNLELKQKLDKLQKRVSLLVADSQ